MDIFSTTIFTAWFAYMALMIWIIIGAAILTPCVNIINKIEPMDCSYNDKIDALRQIVVWPYILYKVYKYNKENQTNE